MVLPELSLFEKNCWATNLLGSVGFRWDTSQKRMNSIQNRKKLQILNRKCAFQALVCLVVLAQALIKNEKDRCQTALEKLTVAIGLVVHFGDGVYLQICRWKSTEVAQYINAVIQVSSEESLVANNGQGRRHRNLLQKLNVLVGYLMLISLYTYFPVVMTTVFWRQPCTPALAGYWLIPECGNPKCFRNLSGLVTNFLVKYSIFLINGWVTFFACSVAPFFVVNVHLICTLTLSELLRRFQEIARDASIPTEKIAGLFRRIQLLGQLANEFQNRLLFTTLICISIVAQPTCLIALIRMNFREKNLLQIFLNLLMTADFCTYIMVIGGGMGRVFQASKEAKLEAKRSLVRMKVTGSGTGKELKWRRRLIQSFKHVRISFGAMNFVEESTPLKYQDQANNLTVELLLVFSV